MDTVTWSPARMTAPPSRVPTVAYRSTTAAAGSSRSDSSTAAATRSGSASTRASWAGEESRCSTALAIMPSVVSMPPNISTAAFEMASCSASGPVTSASREPPPAITSRRLAASSPNAVVPTVATLAAPPSALPRPRRRRRPGPRPRSRRTRPGSSPGSSCPRPRASAMTAAASGPATARRSSAAPCGSIADTSRPVSARVNAASRACTWSCRNGRVERAPVARVRRAVQREHARPDHLRGGEPGSSTVNVARVAQDRHGQVVAGDQPGARTGTQHGGRRGPQPRPAPDADRPPGRPA